jgi:hypothetical protein
LRFREIEFSCGLPVGRLKADISEAALKENRKRAASKLVIGAAHVALVTGDDPSGDARPFHGKCERVSSFVAATGLQRILENKEE